MKEKNDDGRGAARIILRAVFPVLAAAGIAGYFIYLKATGREITVANIVEHAPKSALPAAAVLLVLYVIKSLSVFFPVTVLYAVGGYMLGPVVGCIVNALGVAMGFVIQYRFGSASGHAAAGKISAKHPRIAAMLDAQSRSPVFAVFRCGFSALYLPTLSAIISAPWASASEHLCSAAFSAFCRGLLPLRYSVHRRPIRHPRFL